jgi:hypothetical protein
VIGTCRAGARWRGSTRADGWTAAESGRASQGRPVGSRPAQFAPTIRAVVGFGRLLATTWTEQRGTHDTSRTKYHARVLAERSMRGPDCSTSSQNNRGLSVAVASALNSGLSPTMRTCNPPSAAWTSTSSPTCRPEWPRQEEAARFAGCIDDHDGFDLALQHVWRNGPQRNLGIDLDHRTHQVLNHDRHPRLARTLPRTRRDCRLRGVNTEQQSWLRCSKSCRRIGRLPSAQGAGATLSVFCARGRVC